MITPREAYRSLLKCYGPQGWWPVTPRGGLTPRYHPGVFALPRRRETLEICVGAVLTQNTAWTNVVRALESLNAAQALSLERIERIPRRCLETLIHSSGFYVQKTLKLKALARHIRSRGRPLERWLREERLPELREDLLSIKGVGPETADSMLLYAGGRPVFVVDAYTKRIGSRLGWYGANASYSDVRRFLVDRLPRSIKAYQELHALFVELGKRACRRRPVCARCPLAARCRQARGSEAR